MVSIHKEAVGEGFYGGCKYHHSVFVTCHSGEEVGMLEDMEVGISDLHRVVFQITEAKTDELADLQPLVCGRR